MKSFILIDFEDSFTWNIYSCLTERGWVGRVVNYKSFLHKPALNKNSLIILGPGPGHIEDYYAFTLELKKWLNVEGQIFAGVCLGHQLLSSVVGAEVIACKKPKHGQTVSLALPDWKIFPPHDRGKTIEVQLYHSQAVRFKRTNSSVLCHKSSDGEVLLCLGANFLSYQFHPESVGTSYPDVFFGALEKFFYNRINGLRQRSMEWHL